MPLTVQIPTNWKIFKEMGIPDYLTCQLNNLYAGQEATVRTRQGYWTWLGWTWNQTDSKSGKEYVKSVYCHPAYLTYIQNTS